MPAAGQAPDKKTLKIVLSASLRVVDPIFQSAYPVRNHGYLVYDTLFGVDDQYRPHPQMVKEWTVSDDKLLYTFTLREGLKFHDGKPVTSEDVVASIKRWGSRDLSGLTLMEFTQELAAVNDRTFTLKLKEPYGLVLQSLGKPSTYVPFIMPKRLADTPSNQPVTEVVGSGPFRFIASEFQPGVKAVYEKFADYIPRSEPPVWNSGGKVAHVDRIEWVNMPEPQTAANALINGEVDFVESPPFDLLPLLQSSKGVKVEDILQVGGIGVMYPNWLNPPFNKVEIRKALLYAIGQEDVLAAQIGDAKYYRECKAMFVCGTPLATDAGAPERLPDYEKAKQFLKDGGYKGEKVVILQATDIAVLSPVALITAQALRRIGMTVEVQSMDVQTVFARRGIQAPVENGGWSIYNGYTQSVQSVDPIINVGVNGRGRNGGWFGWHESADLVRMRGEFMRETDEGKRKQIAGNIQKLAYDLVTYVPTGMFDLPYAFRDNLKGLVKGPGPVFWNVRKE